MEHNGSRRVYVSLRRLPDACLPAHVVRRRGVTVLLVDARSSKLEIVAYCADHLTEAENNVLRAACGQPPVGQSMSPDMTEGPCLTELPETLVMPTEVPAQSGPIDGDASPQRCPRTT